MTQCVSQRKNLLILIITMCLNPTIINNRKYICMQNNYPCLSLNGREMYYTRPTSEPYNYKYFNRRNLGVNHDNIDRYYAFNPVTGEKIPLFIEVPCCKCLECQASKTSQINNRMLIEQIGHGNIIPLFFTLTYSDKYLPKDRSVNKLDVRLFINRLYTYLRRKGYQGPTPRHIVFSEYSPTNFRPHYHGIIYGLDVSQVFPKYLDFIEWFESVWGKGFVNIKHFLPHGFQYVSKYLLKEKYNPSHLKPNFWFGSRVGGGIGTLALNNPDFLDAVRLNTSTFRFKFKICGELHTVTVPPYLRKKLYPTACQLLPKEVRDAVYNICFASHLAQLKLVQSPYLSELESIADSEFPTEFLKYYPYFRCIYDIDTCPSDDTLHNFVETLSASAIIEKYESSYDVLSCFISSPLRDRYIDALMHHDSLMASYYDRCKQYIESLPPVEDRIVLLTNELNKVKSRDHYCG
ncbi:replication initiator protein [Microvirus mar51]|uniref:Replication initiator protein n=1 Tax=Microvirus mar51 TaxID=2851187 RepID=A0A8F5RC39_9VIRU|nr:replication initiator protein [Microvirus mar51]